MRTKILGYSVQNLTIEIKGKAPHTPKARPKPRRRLLDRLQDRLDAFSWRVGVGLAVLTGLTKGVRYA